MEQSMTQLYRNIRGYRLVNQYGLELITSRSYSKMKERNIMKEDIGVKEVKNQLEDKKYVIYNKESLKKAGIKITSVIEEYISEEFDSIITVNYENKEGLGQVEYLSKKTLEIESNEYFKLVLIEEE